MPSLALSEPLIIGNETRKELTFANCLAEDIDAPFLDRTDTHTRDYRVQVRAGSSHSYA